MYLSPVNIQFLSHTNSNLSPFWAVVCDDKTFWVAVDRTCPFSITGMEHFSEDVVAADGILKSEMPKQN